MFHGGMGGHPMGGPKGDHEEALGKVYDNKVVSRLPGYLKPVKGWISIGVIGMLLGAGAQLVMPYLVGVGTDAIEATNTSGLVIAAIFYVVASLGMWAGRFMETKYLAYAGQNVILKLRTQMFEQLQRLSMGFFDRNQAGKLMSRVQNDAQELQELLTQGIFAMITNLLTVVGIAVIMLVMNLKLALVTLAVVPLLIIFISIWQKFARRAFLTVRRAIATVNSQLQEDIAGVRVIQGLSREKENFEQFDEVNRAHLDANVTAVKMEGFMMPTVNVLTGVSFALVIIVGGFQVMDGAMGIGTLLAFLLYIQRFFEPVLELSMNYTQLQRAMASGARIFELLDVEPEIEDKPGAGELPSVSGEIRFEGVHFSYEEGKEILHNIDLAIKAGETVAIVGQTGSGKSSLVSLTSRFYEVDDGRVTVDGYDVRDVTQKSLRDQIGIVPQTPMLFSGTIEENIRYGKDDASHEEVVEIAKTVGANHFISRLEQGYDTQVGQRGGSLSAGQRQLICLARAVLADPRILILDEATSNVDTNTERIMQRALSRLTKGRTCLTIAHRLSTVTGAKRIIVMDHGNIIETGSHQELMEQEGTYYKMYKTLSSSPASN